MGVVVGVMVGWLLAESRGNWIESELPGFCYVAPALPFMDTISGFGSALSPATLFGKGGRFCGCGGWIDAGNREKGSLTSWLPFVECRIACSSKGDDWKGVCCSG